MRDVEVTLTFRARTRSPRRSSNCTRSITHRALRKVGCSAVLERRLREKGIEEAGVRVLELVPRSTGAKNAGDREWHWADLLGCPKETHHSRMTRGRIK
jgi:hypothetical protein